VVDALYVDPKGIYPRLLGPEHCWDEARDARTYAGPGPVVAHPPCQRWGRYWSGGPSVRTPRLLGDDGGCFEAALAAVRQFGGVLEHPEASHAFAAYGLAKPRWRTGWVQAGDGLGHVCCVAQGNYGHAARKLTWLYAVGVALPELDWSIPPPSVGRLDEGYHSAEERRRAVKTGACQRLSHKQRLGTPQAFAEMLIAMARSRT
jgi:hypothetical protein